MAKGQNGETLVRVLIVVRRNTAGETFATFQNRSNVGGRDKRVSYRVPAADYQEIIKEATAVISEACKGAKAPAQTSMKAARR